MTTTIPDLIRTVSEVLTTAEELVEEGDSEQVGIMLTSFLKTLMVDLDKLLVDQGATGVRPERRRPASEDNNPNRTPPGRGKGDRRTIIPNKYEGTCNKCDRKVERMQGYVTPNSYWEKGSGVKKWLTWCPGHIPA